MFFFLHEPGSIFTRVNVVIPSMLRLVHFAPCFSFVEMSCCTPDENTVRPVMHVLPVGLINRCIVADSMYYGYLGMSMYKFPSVASI